MLDMRSTWATAPKLPPLVVLLIAVMIQGAYARHALKDMAPITRDGLAWINELGGGQDYRGYYLNPVSSIEALGVQLSEGWHVAPMGFHNSGHAIRFFVQGGLIIKQDYQFRVVQFCDQRDRRCRRGMR